MTIVGLSASRSSLKSYSGVVVPLLASAIAGVASSDTATYFKLIVPLGWIAQVPPNYLSSLCPCALNRTVRP